MGREVRMVPPNWEHPEYMAHGLRGGPEMRLQPMFDSSYEAASREWIEEFIKWHVAKEYPDYASEEDKKLPYWDWGGPPPNEKYYRPWKDEDATWFQVWETVSEGTPVTPPFETQLELIEYLVANGDYWDQSRGSGPWSRENAESFVGTGWAPSFVVTSKCVFDGAKHAAEIETAIGVKKEASGNE